MKDETGYNPPSPNVYAVYHMLQLAEQGRPVEVAAQYIASWFLSGELTGADIVDELDKIRERTMDLMLNPQNVWDGLLPGGPQGEYIGDLLTTIGMDYFGKLERNVQEMIDIFGLDITDDDRMERIHKYLLRDGLVKPVEVDPFLYTCSIIVNPSVGHDGPVGMVVMDAWEEGAESPLDFAKTAVEKMDYLDMIGRWPAEELAMWMTNKKHGTHYVMAWNQANALVALRECEAKLEAVGFEYPNTDEDIVQGIQDMMVIAGREMMMKKDA